MRIHSIAVAAATVFLFAGTASAQVISLATTKGGATAQVSNTIAKVVSQKSGTQMRNQVMGGTQQYIPVVNAGEVDGGLTIDEMNKVPVIALRQHWNAFKQGKIDAVIGAVGAGILNDLNVSVKGGVKYISLDTSDEALKRTLAVYPGSYLKTVNPAKPLAGVLEPVNVLHFDYLLWTHKAASDEMVYKVVKAMYENEKMLKESGPLWRSHSSKRMGKDQGFAYHPGAVKFYKEVGAL